jgi:hypothetical protein
VPTRAGSAEEPVDFTQDDGKQPPLSAAALAEVDPSPEDISQTQAPGKKRRKGAAGAAIRVKKEPIPRPQPSADLPDDPVSQA